MKTIKTKLLNILSIKPIFNFFIKITKKEVNNYLAYITLIIFFVILLILILKNVI